MANTEAATANREASPELIERSVAVIVAQARAGVVTALVVGSLFGVILVPKAGWVRFLAWYAVFAAGMLARQPYFKALISRNGATEATLHRIALAAAVSGWFVTTVVPLFSHFLTIADIGVLSMITVAWVSLGVSMLAVQPRIYTGYVAASLGTIYLGWMRHASLQEVVLMGVALGLGMPMMVRLARTLNTQLREMVQAAQDKAQVVEQLRQALKNQQETQRARSRFLGAASHDLRQPVQALMFLSDIFRKSSDPARRDAMAVQIVRTSQSIDGMFRHLVDFAQIDAGTMKAVVQPVQLQPLVGSASSGFAEKCAARGLRFRCVIDGPCTVWADPVLVERMLRNFLDNAFKYSLQGEILLHADCNGKEAVVAVSDQGVGMEPDDLAQACNAFYRGRSAARAEAEGIGLGLAISRHMADLMQAALEIESQPGQGTRVTMRLPLAPEAAPVPAPAAPGQRSAPLKDLRVAVLENDRLAREALCAWLLEAGARVVAAASLAQLEEGLAGAGQPPGLLIADYRLTEGTGMAAVEAIRARFGAVPALIVSGEADLAERGLPVPVLQKPVTPDRLLEALQGMLEPPRPASAPVAALDAPA